MLVGECTREKRRNVLIRNVVRSLLQKFTTPSIALRSVDELLPIKICLQIITRKRIIKIKKEYVKLQIAIQFFLATIKKKFVKVVKEKDILSVLCRGAGLKNRLGVKTHDAWEIGIFCEKL